MFSSKATEEIKPEKCAMQEGVEHWILAAWKSRDKERLMLMNHGYDLSHVEIPIKKFKGCKR